MADDDTAAVADEPAADPRLRAGQNEASVTPNPRAFLNSDEAERHAADQAVSADQGPKFDPNTGQQLRD